MDHAKFDFYTGKHPYFLFMCSLLVYLLFYLLLLHSPDSRKQSIDKEMIKALTASGLIILKLKAGSLRLSSIYL